MDTLVPVVNQLQELYASLDDSVAKDRLPTLLDLPQIAVVGSQSVGKSSILEAIIGHSCLPRGNGMVTKCPLILQLRHVSQESVQQMIRECDCLVRSSSINTHRMEPSQAFFAEFAHQTNRGYTEADAIATEITVRTATILRDAQASVPAGEAAPAVTSKPIILKLYSPTVIDLTLIDLPGLIRVPTQDQPTDIDEQVKRMVMTYVRSNNCVILAVSAANVDLANSDSLRMAREVDPTGQRTIGVLTKTDLVDDSGQLLQILEGKVYPLRRGYVPIKCRSQKDSVQGVTLEESLRQERRFFATHPLLSPIASQCGVGHLARKLNQILTHHIRLHLPAMKSTIDTLLTEVERDLRRLGTPLDPKTSAAGGLLLQVFTRYARIVDDLLDGRAGPALNKHNDTNDNEVDSMPAACELVGGARLHYVFQDWFAPAIMRSDPLARLTDREIKMAIRNASGSSTSLFVPETAFEMLVKKQIHLLEQPAVQCVHQAVQEMLTITEFPIYQMNEFKRFPNLETRVREISKGVIIDHLSTTLKSVTDFIRIELAFINKSHPDFVGGNRAIANYLVNAARNCGDNQAPILDSGAVAGKNPSYPTGAPTPNTKDGSGSNESTEPPPGVPKAPGAATPTTGNSDSDENNKQQSFLSFWRRHPLQQTTAPPQLSSRPSAPSSRTVSNRRHSGSPDEVVQLPAVPYTTATNSRIPHSASIPHNASIPTPAQMSHRGLQSPAFMLPLGPTDFLPVDQSDRETMELELVKGLISSYFEIVKKTMSDIIPKTIMHFLVNASRDALHGELVTKLYREELFASLLEEAPSVPETRQRALARRDTLRKAHSVLGQVHKELISTQTVNDLIAANMPGAT